MRKYSELLPSYLDGENIRNHSHVLEYVDKNLDTLVDLIRSWSTLDRQILIERVQEHDNRADYTVHINTKAPIKKITVQIDNYSPSVYEYDEETCVTHESLSFENIPDQGHIVVQVPMVVRVETYDDIIYVKAYPENDISQGNMYDHDEFLDIVGRLLGVPRRTYKDWISESENPDYDVWNTFPKYFVKYVDGDMVAGTEDDWYYYQRLSYFVENYDSSFLPALMMKILYEWEHINVSTVYNRKTSVTTPILNSFYMITSEDDNTYINIDDTQRETQIKQYDILTRPSLVSYTRETVMRGENPSTTVYPNYTFLKHTLTPSDDTSTFVTDAPFNVQLDGMESRICYSDRTLYDSDDDMYLLPVAPLPPGEHAVDVQYTGEYEFLSSNSVEYDVDVDNELLLDLDAWKYGKAYGTKATVFNPPRVTNNNYLSVGRGNLVYTPAVYVPFLDESIVITTIFKYGYKYSTLGFGGITQVTSESIDRKDKGMYFNAYDKLGESNYGIEQVYSVHIENNYCYTYLNGIRVAQRQNLTGREDILCIAGYSNSEETDLNQQGLYIQNITLTKARAMDLETTNKKIIERTDKPLARMPEMTISGYDVGNWHVPHFTDIKVDSTTRNVTITVQFYTTRTSDWRMGFGKDNGTGTGWGRTFFSSTDATYTAGEHEITFICDNAGTWTALFDGESCNMPPFVLDTQKNFACYVSYDTGQIFIKNINIGGNNVVATSLAVETISAMEGSAEIQATLTSGETGINNAIITCKNGTSTVTSATTDSNGVCTLDLSSLQAGSYNLTVEYAGDSTYRSTSTTHTITIMDHVVINDDCTTLNNWNVSDTRTMPTITTVADKTGVTPYNHAYARTFWKYPLVRGANTTISFKFYTTDSSTYASLGVLTLKSAAPEPQDVTAIRQYVGGWRKWGTDNGSDRQGSEISRSTWHDITYSLEDDVLKIYVDNTLQCTQTIGTIDSNQYFNDYFFLGHGRWSNNVSFVITDIQYTSDTIISDSTIASIIAAHKAQF